ncbi:hypothetical protein [Bradyrhizobium elkanii]|uniref:Uncharacterized protein n=1 Tax=Bradyrhizobium diazoefficiens TaxID=1355477 RepID=A0A809Z7B2_9BRAD|nr:hypothetical protein [Bradyrhizobium elkanii]BCE22187.1 hypothetical protein XF1B_48680 [Bradyrhizobium diazoefficiens]WLA44092.1 hypothetical protein QNJ95_22735 [Bradyrhizobium elkanii]BCE48452.1 hypothetical protein XF4B_48010 [Bradyrhizobium diazoefficiens]BCE91968.1 hypothetical protein XF10B_47660 [Bradyrhizobium diazoefficiens]BCF26896.1 hypothetical protein XF14B_48480 [Bradyrhizobium diazoefficiens]
MLGAKGFRTREATANYKRRIRKLVTDEVRAARFANLHGNAEASPEPVAPVEPVEPAATETAPEAVEEQGAETNTEDNSADETGDEAGDEGEGDSEETPDTEGKPATPKKKGGKTAKKKSE